MKRIAIVVAIAATGFAAYRWHARTDTPATIADGGGNAKLTLDRLWIDHIPKDDKDPIKVFVALTKQPIGWFQTTSAWKGEYEAFQFERKGGEIRAVYPQTGDREKFVVASSECHDSHMDYCLEIKGASRGTKHYYSMKGWELDGADLAAVSARVDALVHVAH